MVAHKVRRLCVGLVWLCLVLLTTDASARNYPLFVVYTTKPVKVVKRWNPLALYLSKNIGETFKVTPLLYDDFIREVETGQPALVVTNLLNYGALKEKAGLIPIAVPAWNVAGQGIGEYGAVIFARKGSGIGAPADLTGKVVMVPSRYSLAALVGLKTLNDLGIKVTDLALIKSVKTHENVVFGVVNGAADAGIVRTGTLEEMAEHKAVNLDDIVVINRQFDAFPYMHSTVLYPEWLLCATGSLPAGIVESIKKTLASMDVTHEVSLQMGLWGWKTLEEGTLPSVAPLFDIQKMVP
ncbi:phosphate/phosphite/phosphonate ABC transporter substrate-binding protein [Thermodesulforhabdus norvegica]|uniref:ABC-type phosphate/phosphonate transport system, substrate-binding protein n=1 Tax=Thermodesulforhabdus norvegica TaxID=39841 RepID=A0A1I4V6D1_9BACT|nr:phosphate/phosphite/phosphonate ABC transporter substrate-binding protein [Thermodesulforhabdus norvegica]SFM96540.1 ABC-type phosphate/phosphonate transport system, substrate-binding protein [Thermodesulforhabdus norvegica]